MRKEKIIIITGIIIVVICIAATVLFRINNTQSQPKLVNKGNVVMPKIAFHSPSLNDSSEIVKNNISSSEKAEQLYHSITEVVKINDSNNYWFVIKACNNLVNEYPDTKQAENAKKLLMEIPSEYIKQYEEQMAYMQEPKVKKTKMLRSPRMPNIDHKIDIEKLSQSN